MPKTSQITVDVALDESKVPENISWKATDSEADGDNDAAAMFLSFWDHVGKSALRIDLWTKDMTVDEMANFTYQTMMGIAETFKRATKDEELANGIRKFSEDFITRFNTKQKVSTTPSENKPTT